MTNTHTHTHTGTAHTNHPAHTGLDPRAKREYWHVSFGSRLPCERLSFQRGVPHLTSPLAAMTHSG